MISWLTWNVALWIIGSMALITYLWYDGKNLLGDIGQMLCAIIMTVYVTIVLGCVIFPAIIGGILIGPFVRLLFHKDTSNWAGTVFTVVSQKAFAWVDPLKGIDEKKLAEIDAEYEALVDAQLEEMLRKCND